MATTQTLEESYWWNRRQGSLDARAERGVRRWFKVPRVAFDALKPSMGDTAYDDSTLVVTAAKSGGIISATLEWLVVEYVTPGTGGAV